MQKHPFTWSVSKMILPQNSKSLLMPFLGRFSFKRILVNLFIGWIQLEKMVHWIGTLDWRVVIKAIPVERSQLRLYCYRINEEFLIWAGGGHKITRTFEEDPKLDFQVDIIRQVGEQLNQRINRGSITKQYQQLIGNLEFEIEL